MKEATTVRSRPKLKTPQRLTLRRLAMDDVGPHRHPQEQTLQLPVLGNQAEAVGDGVPAGADLDAPPVEEDLARVVGIAAEDRLQDLGAARAHQAGDAQDLARA